MKRRWSSIIYLFIFAAVIVDTHCRFHHRRQMTLFDFRSLKDGYAVCF